MDRQADRRRQARVTFFDKIYVMHKGTTLPPCPCFDISEGGIRLATSLPVESSVQLLVTLPLSYEKRTFLVEGIVRWRRLNASGVSFVNLSHPARICLHEYMLSKSASGKNN